MKTTFNATRRGRVALVCAQACFFFASPSHACEDCGDEDVVAAAAPLAPPQAPAQPLGQSSRLGLVVISGSALSSLPSQLPTTLESISAAEIEKSINATDAGDALKYLPSLLVRKRYIGDYNHAVLSTRASGTGNSARSLVYADGIPISNLLGNGAGFTPRWGMLTPEEIERVDVLYGPFSAAYSGNSVGAVVDYQTRMPKAFEAHAKLGFFHQPFELYGTRANFDGHQVSASLGDRVQAFSWWINVNRLDSDGQPLTFITKPLSTTATAATATVLTGAVPNADRSNLPWLILGAGTQYHTLQDQAKLKLSYELSPGLRSSYTLGWWNNQAQSQSDSYLRDAAGNTFFAATANSGTLAASPVSLDGKAYALGANDFGQSRERLEHLLQGISLKSNSHSEFDFDLAASRYDYRQDQVRSPLLARPGADVAGAGRITDLAGTGWQTLAAKGVWRPLGTAHSVDFGLSQESYRWQQKVSDALDWLHGAPTALFTAFSGQTQMRSLFAQDAWVISERLKAVLGVRVEEWRAQDGLKTAASGQTVGYAKRVEHYVSPKAAVGYELSSDWAVKLSTGRAVRMPTVGELYQGGVNAAGVYVAGDPVTQPNLKPEQGWTTELSALWASGQQQLRSTLFHEDTRDALYSQTALVDGKNVSSTQNIQRIRTQGIELAYQAGDLIAKGLDLQASLTFADSKILANSGFVTLPGDTLGKQQPRVPRWRGALLASYAITPALSASYGLRYSGAQFGTLNNSDPNGFTYQGFSKFFTTDLRVFHRLNQQWSVAAGIDNLNNYQYWNFHPYPQRSYHAELKFDL